MMLDLIGRRWPDGREGVVLERAGEHADAAHWDVVSAERLRLARAEQAARHRQYADEERRASLQPRDQHDDGTPDWLESERV